MVSFFRRLNLRRLRVGLAALFAVMAASVMMLGAVAPAQATVTWANQPVRTTSDPFAGGQLITKLRFQISQGESPQRVRLDAAQDISIQNTSGADICFLQIHGGGRNGLTWQRLSESPSSPTRYASSYFYGGVGNSFTVHKHSTSVLSADNPNRWFREDGVVDSDPSPAGTPLSVNSQPAIEFYGFSCDGQTPVDTVDQIVFYLA